MKLLAAVDQEGQEGQPGLVFALSFMACAIMAAAFMLYLPEPIWTGLRDVTIAAAKGVGALCGLAMLSDGDILTVNGFSMRIIRQCTAIDYLAFLSIAILLYRRHRLSYRLLGVAVAVPIIVLANAVRLVVSGLVGTGSRRAFEFAHDYLWVVAFALFVFGLWTLWLNGRLLPSSKAVRGIVLAVAVSAGVYGLFHLVHDAYGDLMARAGTFIYGFLYDDHGGQIVRSGDAMEYVHAGRRFSLHTMTEEVNIAAYLGLMAPLQKRGGWNVAVLTLMGLVSMMAMGATFIAIDCGFAVTAGKSAAVGFLSIGSIVHLSLPMAVYWIVTRVSADTASEPAAAQTARPRKSEL
ncbi:exosortase/archaeosortase family protein [Geomonas sp. Red32]|uniref:exosortase/archaeosortase family protein n=1 Tax=Geomonas sp. Red32 TaxID=2912856 RepID=UPI00202CCF63|nr:exosortase/archaeosortase family protein [Geomonas sp. Red32]MCM0084196.1 exosortase/archaeosortase family protein [Geomonas sp. Red32]